MPDSFIEFATHTSDPILLDGKTLQLASRALVLRLPRSLGGLVWNRPISVSVRTTDGRDETWPVHDWTRLTEFAILGFGLLGSILIGLAWRKLMR